MKVQIFPNCCRSSLVCIDATKYDHIIIETFYPHTLEEKRAIVKGLKDLVEIFEQEWLKREEKNNDEER